MSCLFIPLIIATAWWLTYEKYCGAPNVLWILLFCLTFMPGIYLIAFIFARFKHKNNSCMKRMLCSTKGEVLKLMDWYQLIMLTILWSWGWAFLWTDQDGKFYQNDNCFDAELSGKGNRFYAILMRIFWALTSMRLIFGTGQSIIYLSYFMGWIGADSVKMKPWLSLRKSRRTRTRPRLTRIFTCFSAKRHSSSPDASTAALIQWLSILTILIKKSSQLSPNLRLLSQIQF